MAGKCGSAGRLQRLQQQGQLWHVQVFRMPLLCAIAQAIFWQTLDPLQIRKNLSKDYRDAKSVECSAEQSYKHAGQANQRIHGNP